MNINVGQDQNMGMGGYVNNSPNMNANAYGSPSVNPGSYNSPNMNANAYGSPSVNPGSYSSPSVNANAYGSPSVNTNAYGSPNVDPSSYSSPSMAPGSYSSPTVNVRPPLSPKKKTKVTFNAPITLTFVLVCFASLLLGFLTDGWTTDHLFSVYRSSLLSPLTYVRFVGHVFGHANWEHFLGNMMTLLIIAPLLEEKYGSGNILFVILTTAVTTGVLSYILFPNVQLLGASGVVFAFILLSSITSVKEGEIPLTFILVAVLYLGEQVYDGLFIDDNVSNFGHILGGVCGSVIGYRLNKGGKAGLSRGNSSGASNEKYTYY